MPIYDQSYRHWDGVLKSHIIRWWPITKEGLKILLRKKFFTILLMISLMPCIAYGVGIYLLNRLGDSFMAVGLGRVLKIDGRFFNSYLTNQIGFLMFVSVFGGSGLISNDLRHNALQIYLSKPLTRFDYLLGKFGVLLALLSFITLLPAVSLFLEQALLSSNLTFLKTEYKLLWPILLYSLLLIFSHAFLIMAFSSLTQSSRYAAITFGSVVLFSQIIFQSFRGISHGNKTLVVISFVENLKTIGNKLFKAEPSEPELWKWCLLVITTLMAICILTLYKRIRGMDIVK